MSPLNIQLPDSLYKSLQKLAEQDGVSLDQFVVLGHWFRLMGIAYPRLDNG